MTTRKPNYPSFARPALAALMIISLCFAITGALMMINDLINDGPGFGLMIGSTAGITAALTWQAHTHITRIFKEAESPSAHKSQE